MKDHRLHIHTHSLSCSEVYDHLCDNLDEKLNSESCRQIKAHIADCENCTALLDSLKKTVYLYRHYPTPKLPKKIKKELFAVIRYDNSKTKSKSRR